jgi:endonuclease VIII
VAAPGHRRRKAKDPLGDVGQDTSGRINPAGRETMLTMPEGDTVWLAGRRLNNALAGHALTRSDFRVPQHATADLTGRTVTEVVSRGKHLLFRLDAGNAGDGSDHRGGDGLLTLHTHFRMDGSWHLYRHGTRWRGGPEWQVRVLLENAEWQAVGYRLPVVELLPRDREDDVVGHLGPDLLGPDWDPAEAVRRLQADPQRSIGEALLDQRNLAGIGTLYRAETLFLRGVHPRRPVADVPDLEAVVEVARRLMHANREHPQQSTTGDTRRGRQHYVFERDRQPCLRCRTPIKVEEFGPVGQERRSYWCPTCQPG